MKHFYKSTCSGEFNARIMKAAVSLANGRYDGFLLNGWHLIVKIQSDGDEQPFYHLDLRDGENGDDLTERKMRMLEALPNSMSGADTPEEMTQIVEYLLRHGTIPADVAGTLIEMLNGCQFLTDIAALEWDYYAHAHGITRRKGGIKIPYKTLKTTDAGAIEERTGEIRIAFDGAGEEWLNIGFALRMFRVIQATIGELWRTDQVQYHLGDGLQNDVAARYWIKELEITGTDLYW